MEAFLHALCDIWVLFWSTLGCNLFQDILVLCETPAHAAANYRTILQLDRWHFLVQITVFLWLGFGAKLVRHIGKLLQEVYQKKEKKEQELLCSCCFIGKVYGVLFMYVYFCHMFPSEFLIFVLVWLCFRQN